MAAKDTASWQPCFFKQHMRMNIKSSASGYNGHACKKSSSITVIRTRSFNSIPGYAFSLRIAIV